MARFRPGADGLHQTYCRLCETQCGMLAEVKAGKIVHVGPDLNFFIVHMGCM